MIRRPAVRTALEGVALETPSGLRLLSARAVIDVDSGTRHRISGLPRVMENWWAQQAGRDLIITVDCVTCRNRPTVFVVRDGTFVAERVATGVFVVPASDRTLWAKTSSD